MIAAYLIIKGGSLESAISQVRAAESKAVETATQIQFLKQLATPRTPNT